MVGELAKLLEHFAVFISALFIPILQVIDIIVTSFSTTKYLMTILVVFTAASIRVGPVV